MTRYTNVRFKRTHVEAGFSNSVPDGNGEVGESKALGEAESGLLKKKRKRSHASKQGEGASTVTVKEGITDGKPEYSNYTGAARVGQKFSRKDRVMRQKSSDKRRQMRINERLGNTICFACREKGHAIKDCPSGTGKSAVSTKSDSVGICYRCGSKRHSLSRCPKPIPEDPDNPLPFATCFVCKSSGHLVSTCPSNKEKGIYPNGGCCKLCGETSHLAKDCGLRRDSIHKSDILIGSGKDAGADEDDFHIISRRRKEVDDEEDIETSKKKGKIKRLVGGKIIVRVPDPPPALPTRKPPPPPLKVKTVVF